MDEDIAVVKSPQDNHVSFETLEARNGVNG
jgi:hypothetical protein